MNMDILTHDIPAKLSEVFVQYKGTIGYIPFIGCERDEDEYEEDNRDDTESPLNTRHIPHHDKRISKWDDGCRFLDSGSRLVPFVFKKGDNLYQRFVDVEDISEIEDPYGLRIVDGKVIGLWLDPTDSRSYKLGIPRYRLLAIHYTNKNNSGYERLLFFVKKTLQYLSTKNRESETQRVLSPMVFSTCRGDPNERIVDICYALGAQSTKLGTWYERDNKLVTSCEYVSENYIRRLL